MKKLIEKIKAKVKELLGKVKGFWDLVKGKLGEIYKAAEKWFGVFLLGHKVEAVALFLASFAFVVDMTAGTRFNAFLAPVLVGMLGRRIVLAEQQKKVVADLEAKLAKKE